MKIRMRPETLGMGQYILFSLKGGIKVGGGTDKRRTLQRMMMSKWKMFAMPSAKQRIMHSTPVLVRCISFCACRKTSGKLAMRTIVRIYL
jgi:hypothetical protein